ncbi:MAG: carbohydrate ABC transporter permease [Abditibacteriales bacterium]|nr:carbohydrate ABC transporter permease [Abditibacteriales bacterium]MDW8365018.1 carbohydrate ABC transporter permease [Abditibacteriales bacterium]
MRKFLSYAALSALGVLFLLPFAWMVVTSLKADAQVMTPVPEWIPRPLVWENYTKALQSFPFLRYLGNTLVICALAVIGTVISCALPAYGFARLRWRGRDALFFIMLSTLMLPSQVTLLPTFLLFRWLGWTDTIAPLTVPAFFGSAFSIFLLRQFFLTIPAELSDAARIDGCNEWMIFWRVVAPLAKPALATVALFSFTSAWMDFMGPLIYLNDDNKYTLALGLLSFLGRYTQSFNLLMAASTLITIPPVVIFLLAQRAFLRGIALTGLKG